MERQVFTFGFGSYAEDSTPLRKAYVVIDAPTKELARKTMDVRYGVGGWCMQYDSEEIDTKKYELWMLEHITLTIREGKKPDEQAENH